MSEDHRDSLRRLMAIVDIRSLGAAKALANMADLVELSDHFNEPEGTNRALEWAEALEHSALTPGQRALLNFYRANAWDDRRKIEHQGKAYQLDWNQPELRSQLLSLRRAVDETGISELEPTQQAMIHTNLANQLSAAGRIVDAGEEWERAIAANSRFAMALGNRGCGWFDYARAYYDRYHQPIFLYRAHQSLSAALDKDADWSSAPANARGRFEKQREHIERMIDIAHFTETFKLDRFSLGRSAREQSYRRWCLRNVLFLNPVNDLGAYEIAAGDVLTLPSYTTPLSEGPTLIGFFNQMKQEFASGRWLLYEGTHTEDATHFADRGVKLHNTLDYPSYSLATEKVKLAFRSAYSILDKVAFFLNDYLVLQIPEREVGFRSIWFEKRGSTELRAAFQGSTNWPLRGLYWLAKDFVDKEFRESTAPDASDFDDIRNHLEHKYLKVHEFSPRRRESSSSSDPFHDRLAFSVGRSELQIKTVRLFKLVRAALIYLCLAMREEERKRTEQKPDDPNKFGPVPMVLETWDDRWKN